MFSLGVIPARGGSKRIPRKNIRDFCGRPLIAWTIAAAKASKLDEVIVSTEDEEIRNVALSCGAMVTTRPQHLATDTARSVDVAIHALEAYESSPLAKAPDVIVLLQPTSPLRTEEDINLALDGLHDAMCLITINSKSGSFAPNGCLYVCRRDCLKSGHLTCARPVFLPQEDMPDIDTEADWQEAEKLMKERLCK